MRSDLVFENGSRVRGRLRVSVRPGRVHGHLRMKLTRRDLFGWVASLAAAAPLAALAVFRPKPKQQWIGHYNEPVRLYADPKWDAELDRMFKQHGDYFTWEGLDEKKLPPPLTQQWVAGQQLSMARFEAQFDAIYKS